MSGKGVGLELGLVTTFSMSEDMTTTRSEVVQTSGSDERRSCRARRVEGNVSMGIIRSMA